MEGEWRASVGPLMHVRGPRGCPWSTLLSSCPRGRQLLRFAFIINLEKFWLPGSALVTAGAGSPGLLAPELASPVSQS